MRFQERSCNSCQPTCETTRRDAFQDVYIAHRTSSISYLCEMFRNVTSLLARGKVVGGIEGHGIGGNTDRIIVRLLTPRHETRKMRQGSVVLSASRRTPGQWRPPLMNGRLSAVGTHNKGSDAATQRGAKPAQAPEENKKHKKGGPRVH